MTIEKRNINHETVLDLTTAILKAVKEMDSDLVPNEFNRMEFMLAFFLAGEMINEMEMPTGDLLGEIYIVYEMFLEQLHADDDEDMH